MHRKFSIKPSLLIFLLCLISTFISSYFDLERKIFNIIVILSLILFILSILLINKRISTIIIILAIFTTFFLRAGMYFHIKQSNDIYNVKTKISGFTGKVCSEVKLKRTRKRKTLHQEFSLKVEYYYNNSKKIKATGKVLVKNKYLLFNLHRGCTVIVSGWITHVKKMRQLSGFNYGKYLWRNGYSHFVWVKRGKAEIVKPVQGSYLKTIIEIKNSLYFHIYENLNYNENVQDFINAFLLGKRDTLNEKIKSDFRKAGIFHVLALSGLHMAMLFTFVFGILVLFNIKKKSTYLITGILLILFTIIAGLKYSLFRALIMALCVVIIKIFQRDSDYLNSLFTAGFIIVLVDPVSVFSISFQLSFLATLGILLFYKPVFNKLSNIRFSKYKAGHFILSSFSVTICAQILIIPLLLHYFGVFYLISFLSNLIVVPLVGVIAFICITGFITFFIPLFSKAFFSVAEILTEVLFRIVKVFSNMSFLALHIKIPLYGVYLYYVAFAMFILFLKTNFKVKNIKKLFCS